MNELYSIKQSYGQDTLKHYFESLYSIASQCPYSGGKAVYQARAALALFTDTIYYDDAMVCAQVGIYRNIISEHHSSNTAFDFSMVPNPASQKVTVTLHFTNEQNIRLEIRNIMGGKVKELELDKGINSITFSVEQFDEGLYFVRARKNRITLSSKKLMIVK